MKRFMRITAVAVLTLLLLLTFTSCGANKGPQSGSGSCGDGVIWEYDADSKALRISGTGSMTNFESSAAAPWAATKSAVKTIVIKDGVKNVGDYAFYCFTALEGVEIADSVKEIGKSAFAFCTTIENIALPNALETIEERAFEGCTELNTALVPASVETIGAHAFSSCKSITVAAVLSDVEIREQTFFNCISMKDLFLSPDITEEMVADSALEGCPITFDDHKDKAGDTLSTDVTVKYLYEDGTEAAEAFNKSYEFGEDYSVVSPTIDGYTADELSIGGYADGHDVEKTVTYTKNPEVTDVIEEEVDEPFSAKDAIPIIILVVLLAGIAVAAVLIVRNQKKTEGASQTVRKNNPSGNKKKK
jgi:hypothetical protein